MILENNLERYGYARVLLAMVHYGEWEWPTINAELKVSVVWDPNGLEDLSDFCRLHEPPQVGDRATAYVLADAAEALFPGLEKLYWADNPYKGDYNAILGQATLVTYQGNRKALSKLYHAACLSLSQPMGGDDTTFDYWPSEFGAAVALAYDLQAMHPEGGYIGDMRGIWDAQVSAAEEQWANWNQDNLDLTPRQRAEMAFTDEVTARP